MEGKNQFFNDSLWFHFQKKIPFFNEIVLLRNKTFMYTENLWSHFYEHKKFLTENQFHSVKR